MILWRFATFFFNNENYHFFFHILETYKILKIDLGYVCFPEFTFRKTIFQTFLCLFDIGKVGQRKTLSSQRKIWLGFQESVFLKNLDEKHFPEVVKNLEISYYLLIISNLIIKLLIAIYILFWIFVFQFHLLKFNFYINFGPYFYNCYLLFPYHFFNEIVYLSNLVLILLIVTYLFFEIIYEMLIIIILISSSFIFFYFLDLISIILIIICFIWDNLWNYIFFQFHSHSTF